MNQEKQYKYGCEVCKHHLKCKPNPFGICKEFEQKEVADGHDENSMAFIKGGE